jgi:hypothetical protein
MNSWEGPKWKALRRPGLCLAVCMTAVVSDLEGEAVGNREAVIQMHLKTITDSSRLRLGTVTGRHEGHLIFRTTDSLGIRDAGRQVHLPLLAVDSLWIERHHTDTGFLVGMGVGAGAYVLLTSLAEEDHDFAQLDNLIGGAIWVGSTLLGGAVGWMIPGWRRVYP